MRAATKGLVLSVLLPCLIAASAAPAGSLTTFGETSVSGVNVQSGTAVFPGDTITTGSSTALFNLSNGRTMQIGPNSSLRVSKDSVVEIVKGMSRMQAKSGSFLMLASSWRLEGQPDAKSHTLAADVVRESDGKVSLNVVSGKVTATSNRGNVVMTAEAGRSLMLPAEAPTTGPSDPPSGSGGGQGPSGSGSSGTHRGLIVGAYIIGAAAIAVGASALASRPTDQTTQVNSLNAQVATLNSQITALNTQTANLLANLNAVAAAAGASAALTAQLDLQIQKLVAAQAALATAQGIINGLVAKLAANGSLNATDQASLASAQATVTAQTAIIAASSTAAAALINQIQQITVPSNFKP